jgi:hypothetical protein
MQTQSLPGPVEGLYLQGWAYSSLKNLVYPITLELTPTWLSTSSLYVPPRTRSKGVMTEMSLPIHNSTIMWYYLSN